MVSVQDKGEISFKNESVFYDSLVSVFKLSFRVLINVDWTAAEMSKDSGKPNYKNSLLFIR